MSRDQIERLADLIRSCSNIVVFTGAGVSTESGASLTIVNREPTPFDAIADLAINAQAGGSMKIAGELTR